MIHTDNMEAKTTNTGNDAKGNKGDGKDKLVRVTAFEAIETSKARLLIDQLLYIRTGERQIEL